MLSLPFDRPRPAVQTYRGGVPSIDIDPELFAQVTFAASGSQTTLFMLFAAAFQILLFRYTGQRDFCIGTGIANRRWRETRDLIGMLVNNIGLRLQTDGDLTLADVLDRVKKITLDAYAHQDLPFDKVVQVVAPVRDLRYNPIFQVLLSFHDSPVVCPPLPRLSMQVEVGLSNGSAKFDMNLIVIPVHASGSSANYGPRTRILWEYNSDLFDAATIKQMMKHYLRVLAEVASHPDRAVSAIEILAPEEQRQILVEWNRTSREYPRYASVHQLFQEQADMTPEATAVIFGDCSLSYAELNKKANRLAHDFASMGITVGDRIGVCVDRGVEMIAALLGILKAGGAYVPLDPGYPLERLRFMVQDAGIRYVLTERKLGFGNESFMATVLFLDDESQQPGIAFEPGNPNLGIDGNDLAYVMYTSGSTGTPKGVEIEHHNIVRLVRDTDYVQFGRGDRVAQLATASFDAATFEIWGALLNGACIVGIGKEEALNPGAIGRAIQSNKISTMFLTTALFNQVVQSDRGAFAGLKYLLFGGEAVDPQIVRSLLRNGCPKQLTHVYGPTEATTYSTWFVVKDVEEAAATVPIGRPLTNAQIYVLDEWQNPVPVGVLGEFYIGGDGVGRDYLNRSALTAEKFVPDYYSQTPGARLYRTGDQVRWLRDGNIEFVGRLDQQVKIRGFRIEPGEVESVVRRAPFVKEAAVIVGTDARGEKQLVAYVVAEDGAAQDTQGLRSYLRERLPEYMIPAIVGMESLPLTANGKLDRGRLPEPEGGGGREGERGEWRKGRRAKSCWRGSGGECCSGSEWGGMRTFSSWEGTHYWRCR